MANEVRLTRFAHLKAMEQDEKQTLNFIIQELKKLSKTIEPPRHFDRWCMSEEERERHLEIEALEFSWIYLEGIKNKL